MQVAATMGVHTSTTRKSVAENSYSLQTANYAITSFRTREDDVGLSENQQVRLRPPSHHSFGFSTPYNSQRGVIQHALYSVAVDSLVNRPTPPANSEKTQKQGTGRSRRSEAGQAKVEVSSPINTPTLMISPNVSFRRQIPQSHLSMQKL